MILQRRIAISKTGSDLAVPHRDFLDSTHFVVLADDFQKDGFICEQCFE
jgi:hypothetical protein